MICSKLIFRKMKLDGTFHRNSDVFGFWAMGGMA